MFADSYDDRCRFIMYGYYISTLLCRNRIITVCQRNGTTTHAMSCKVMFSNTTKTGIQQTTDSSFQKNTRNISEMSKSMVVKKRKERGEVVTVTAATTGMQQHEDGGMKHKVLVITGPTAVGKTASSIQIAKMLHGEIISADSVQVYRGLDIGSAKITETEMDGVPHHCIDILNPEEEFSAGLFHRIAMETIHDIVGRGKTPIVVGGTGFYLKWLVCGRPSTPASTKMSETMVEERLKQCFEDKARAVDKASGDELTPEERWEAGVELVRGLGDEETADRLMYQELNNWYRMKRVVDILLQSPGKTLADLDAESSGDPPYDFRCVYLTRDRVEMYRRIDQRVESMLIDGLVKETAETLSHVEYDSNCATRAIGYRQTMHFLHQMRVKKSKNDSFRCTEEDVIQLTKEIQSASRQLCHRQMHWFRKEDRFRWINATRDPVKDILNVWNTDCCSSEDMKTTRLTKEEEKALKTYQTVMTRLTPGSVDLDRIVQETNDILFS